MTPLPTICGARGASGPPEIRALSTKETPTSVPMRDYHCPFRPYVVSFAGGALKSNEAVPRREFVPRDPRPANQR
jgi:hypothetical protein